MVAKIVQYFFLIVSEVVTRSILGQGKRLPNLEEPIHKFVCICTADELAYFELAHYIQL